MTVSLSGDGADELFGGYNKHRALFRLMHGGTMESMAANLSWLWKTLPKSRNNPLSNKLRQLERFASASKLGPRDRYWFLASFANLSETLSLLNNNIVAEMDLEVFEERKESILSGISEKEATINEYLYTDIKFLLPSDMLTKVDMMSMANSLEVRVPFLDHRLVEFATRIPDEFKVNGKQGKIILQDAFRDLLPMSLYNRSKKGFEVPLLKWFRKELKSLIWNDLLSEDYVRSQGVFNPGSINKLKDKLFSTNPGDSHGTVWALIVFQWWYKKYFEN